MLLLFIRAKPMISPQKILSSSNQAGSDTTINHISALPRYRVVLIDDHALFRSSLAMLLEHAFGFDIVATYSHLAQAQKECSDYKPDIVIMDYHMPDGDALTTGLAIKKQNPQCLLIYLTGTQSSVVLQQLVASTADGVLHKEISPEELRTVFEKLYSDGQPVVSSHIQQKLPTQIQHFTSREFQIFKLLAQGQSTKQAADQLCISTRTAEKHRENLFKKAGVKNLAQLIELGYKWEVFDLRAGS